MSVTGEVELAGGRTVVASPEALSLLVDSRPVFAAPVSELLSASQFTESWTGPLAIFSFRRSDETTVVFDRVVSLHESAGMAVATVAGTGTTATATVTFEPGASPDTTVLRVEVSGMAYQSLSLSTCCDPDGTFHGFGEQYNATEQRGEAFDLIVSEQGIGRQGGVRDFSGDAHTTYFPMPFHLDARGHGLLLRTDHRVSVDLCQANPERARFEVVDAAPIEAVVFHGPTPLDVVRQLGEEVGRPAPPPPWAWGVWIGAQGGRDAILAVADRLEAAAIPTSALWVQDWTGVRRNIGGGFGVQYRWESEPAEYPDLAGMISELRGRGFRFLAYANPFVDPALPNHFDEMDAMGALVRDFDGESYVFAAPNGESAHPDLTNDAARAHVVDALAAIVDDYGVDGWMADFGEWTPLDAVLADGTDPAAAHNRFAVQWHAANRAALDRARPDGDWVSFARSGWTGVQRHSMIHWVGDQEASFSETDGLATVVPAMLNLGLSAVPYVTHDIAGFSGGPSDKELFQRWTELGAFTPIMRTHEGNNRDTNWSWESDAETTDHFQRFARVHEALRPELMALSERAQATGAPLVRHLLLEFPNDAAGYAISDQFMLGSTLLVAPVVEMGATERELYLPPGTWFHIWTGDSYEGGHRITVAAPIGSPPVFSLGGAREDLRAIE